MLIRDEIRKEARRLRVLPRATSIKLSFFVERKNAQQQDGQKNDVESQFPTAPHKNKSQKYFSSLSSLLLSLFSHSLSFKQIYIRLAQLYFAPIVFVKTIATRYRLL